VYCRKPDMARRDWTGWLGHVRFELRNVVTNYPFETSRGFPGSEPNFGHGDHSRLATAPGIRSYGLGSARIFSKRSARTPEAQPLRGPVSPRNRTEILSPQPKLPFFVGSVAYFAPLFNPAFLQPCQPSSRHASPRALDLRSSYPGRFGARFLH
jgi:hypothetical protein